MIWDESGTGSAGQAVDPTAGAEGTFLVHCYNAVYCLGSPWGVSLPDLLFSCWSEVSNIVEGGNRALSANCTSGKWLSHRLLFQNHAGFKAVLKLRSSTALNVGFCLFSVVLLYCLSALGSAFESCQCTPWIIISLCNISVVWTPQKLLQQGHFVELSAG